MFCRVEFGAVATCWGQKVVVLGLVNVEVECSFPERVGLCKAGRCEWGLNVFAGAPVDPSEPLVLRTGGDVESQSLSPCVLEKGPKVGVVDGGEPSWSTRMGGVSTRQEIMLSCLMRTEKGPAKN